MTRDELNQLLDAYLDGDIAEAEAARLAEVIRSGGADAAWVLAQLEAAGLIAVGLDELDSEAFVRGFFERLRAEAEAERFDRDFQARCSLPCTARRWRPVPWLAALAASLLVGVALFLWLQPRPVAAQAIASVEQVEGEVYVVAPDARTAAQPGQPLLPGQGLHVVGDDSRAVIVFPDSTRLELGTGTLTPELLDSGHGGRRDASAAKKVTLAGETSLSVTAAEQPAGRPLILSTPHAEVLVQQGQIDLTSASDTTYLAVEHGTTPVHLTRRKDGKSIEVRGGFTALVAPDEEEMAPQPQAPRITTPRTTLKGHTSYVMNVAFSPDGQTIASCSHDARIRLSRLVSAEELLQLEGHTDRIWCLAFAPAGNLLASGGRDRTARVWDPRTGEVKAVLGGHSDEVHSLAFSPDATLLVRGDRDGVAYGHDLAAGRECFQLVAGRKRGSGALRVLWFSADGRTLGTATTNGLVRFWDATTAQLRSTVQLFRFDDTSLFSLAFSPDGTLVASGGRDGSITLWDTGTGQARATLYGHRAKVLALAFAPDGRYLASGSQDATARLWDVDRLQEVATFAGHQARSGLVNGVAFSPDGRTLATGSVDKTVKLWDVPR